MYDWLCKRYFQSSYRQDSFRIQEGVITFILHVHGRLTTGSSLTDICNLFLKKVLHDRHYLRVIVSRCTHHAAHTAKVGGIESVIGTLYLVKCCRGI